MNFDANKYYIFMICEDASDADQAETLQGISRDNKKKYFGNVDINKINNKTQFSTADRKESDDMLGSFIQFDANEEIEAELTEKDLSQDYFMLNKAQSQMDVTVTTTLKDDKKIKNHIVV